MNQESTSSQQENNNFWEDVYFEALDYKVQFLEKYEEQTRSYPKNSILGKGGVKTVYLSHDWKTERDVALAVPSEKGNEDLAIEFIHEAIILGKLEHPNIIPVYDTGLDEEKTPYFTMKLVKGKNFKAHLVEKENIAEPLKVLPELLEVFKKICQAVSYAHSKKILHLDIKPDNVLIGEFGEVFLCDWGLSEQTDGVKKAIDGTIIKGTPGFMAPELVYKKKSDCRTDVYSLGCLLYYILCKKPPILSSEDIKEFVVNLANNGIRPLENECSFPVPQSLVQIFEKCCQQELEDRYQKVHEIIEELELYTNGFATKAEAAGLLRNLQLLYKRNQIKINIIIFFILLVSALTSYYVMNLRESTKIAIEEKEKAEKLTAQILKKQEEDRKFIQETMDTADYTFELGRSDSTRRFLENSLMVDPNNEEALYNLAQVQIVDGHWIKAKELLERVKNYENENVDKLKSLAVKYEKLPKNTVTQYELSLEVFKMGFEEIFSNILHNLLNDVQTLALKAKYIKVYLELENSIENLDFSYNEATAELIIENAQLSKLRAIKYINIKTLRLLNCDVSAYLSNEIAMTTLDLRNSKVYLLHYNKLKSVETLYMPLNTIRVNLKYANFLKTIYLPKAADKLSVDGFSGEVKFY